VPYRGIGSASFVLARALGGASHVPRSPWWQDVVDRAAAPGRTLFELLALLLGAAIVIQFLFSRSLRRLRIGEFAGPAGEETKATSASTEFQSLVRSRIDLLARAESGDRVGFAPPTGGPVALATTVTQAVPQLGLADVVIQLVQYLLPTNDRTLSAVLLTKSARGVGVSVTMDSRWGGPRDARTFWADELPPIVLTSAEADSYQPFVGFVAAWALHRFRPRRFRALGTSDPESYAVFAASAKRQGQAVSPELVLDAYHRALVIDPDNRPARFNLAVLMLGRATGADREWLVGELEAMRADAARPPAAGPFSAVRDRWWDRLAGVRGVEADPMWWRTTYTLAAQSANAAAALSGEAKWRAELRTAQLARDGVVAGLRVVSRPRFLRTPIARFAADALPSLMVLLAGMLAGDGALVAPAPGAHRSRLWKYGEARRLRIDLQWTRPGWPLPVVSTRLVALLHTLPGGLSARTRYSLACRYAQRSCADDAVRELERAVPGLDDSLIAAAPKDPSLEPIKARAEEICAAEQARRERVKGAGARRVRSPRSPRPGSPAST
jgi:hypothetical protein